MNKKVLMIVHTFPPFGTVGGSIRIVKFLKYLADFNSQWVPSILTIRKEENLLFLGKNSSFSLPEIPEQTRIIRTRTGEIKTFKNSESKFGGILRKLMLLVFKPVDRYLLIPDHKILWGRYLKKAAEKELACHKYSMIYATAPPFSVMCYAVKIKEQSNLPLVLDIKDDWIVKDRFKGIKKLRKPFEACMERKCVEAADKVITVTPKSCEDFKQRYAQFKDKFITIPNGCDTAEYEPFWATRVKKFNKFNMIHAGVFSSRRDLSGLFIAIANLLSRHEEMRDSMEFRIVGRIPYDQWRAIKAAGIESVIRTENYLPRDEYLELLAKSHLPVAINYDIPTLIPGKIYEYWGSRNRMLLLDVQDSAAAKLVKKYDIGDVILANDVMSIENVIRNAWKTSQEGVEELLDTSGLMNFDRKYLTGKLIEVFDEIAGQ